MSTPGIAPIPQRPIRLMTNVPADIGKSGNAAASSSFSPHPAPPSPELSPREVEVLGYLPTMLTAAEIAEELYLSVNTIKAHMRSIYCKLGASRRREAVVRAYTRGILH